MESTVCITKNMCFDKTYFYCTLTVIIMLLAYYVFHILKFNPSRSSKSSEEISTTSTQEQSQAPQFQTQQPSSQQTPPVVVQAVPNTPVAPHVLYNRDLVSRLDYQKISDPLMEPTRRLSRDFLPPRYLARMTGIYSRGVYDTYTPIGYLTKDPSTLLDPDVPKDSSRSSVNVIRDDDRILQLFGKKSDIHPSLYEYYTVTNTGIKIPIHVKKHNYELLDDDRIYIPEFNAHYIARLYKLDSPVYNPYLFW